MMDITKGRVDIDVEYKDNRAEQWCRDVNQLTGEKCSYLRVDQEEFEKYGLKGLGNYINPEKLKTAVSMPYTHDSAIACSNSPNDR